MQICTSGKFTPCPSLKGRVFLYVPITSIDGFGGTEIERQLREDLPAKAEESAAAETIHSGDGISIEYIVLITINTVVPLPGIEELEAETEAEGEFSVEC